MTVFFVRITQSVTANLAGFTLTKLPPKKKTAVWSGIWTDTNARVRESKDSYLRG